MGSRFMMARFSTAGFALVAAVVAPAAPAFAAQCGGNFRTFLAQMERDAQAAGVTQQVIGPTFAGLSPDQAVLAFDRRQHGMFHSKSSRSMRARASSRRASVARGG